jgi:hypothetical protein
MYTSTYKAIVTFVILALVALWGTIIIVSKLPPQPYKPLTYVELYKDCMFNQGVGAAETCKELSIKQMEKQDGQEQSSRTSQ